MRGAIVLALLVLASWSAAATGSSGDCGSGGDAPDLPFTHLDVGMPLDCAGTVDAVDTWDVYRVALIEGPVYATLEVSFGSHAQLCIVDEAWSSGHCVDAWEELSLWWPTAPAILVVVREAGAVSYQLRAWQQDDCGTGRDAPWTPVIPVSRAYVRCEALLDVFEGDSEDAFLIPPPAIPDVVLVRMEPLVPRVQLCVDDEIRQLGLRGRCTDATFSRIVVARDPLRELRVTVEGFGVDPIPYTLVVENLAKNPPQMPPLL